MGWAARLDRALVNFFLDQHVKHEDYIEVCPPFMVNRATMTGTGQLPKFEEDLFKMPAWDYYLIPTAEVPLTNIHAGEVLDEADLPRSSARPCRRPESADHTPRRSSDTAPPRPASVPKPVPPARTRAA